MRNLSDDKDIEKKRYDVRSQQVLSGIETFSFPFGSDSMAEYLRAPYIHYENLIRSNAKPGDKILEIGSGSGLHTKTLLETGAHVTASDIAPSSLMIIERGLKPIFGDNLHTEAADMESLPFSDATFDVVTSAGSLSYGDPDLVNSEIKRVLKQGGIFICVDSLNHNPIYRLNRYVQYLRDKRTSSTIERMPDLRRIDNFRKIFESVDVRFFGAITWAAPLFRPFLGTVGAAKLFDSVDSIVNVRKSAFKFVVIAKK